MSNSERNFLKFTRRITYGYIWPSVNSLISLKYLIWSNIYRCYWLLTYIKNPFRLYPSTLRRKLGLSCSFHWEDDSVARDESPMYFLLLKKKLRKGKKNFLYDEKVRADLTWHEVWDRLEYFSRKGKKKIHLHLIMLTRRGKRRERELYNLFQK